MYMYTVRGNIIGIQYIKNEMSKLAIIIFVNSAFV